MPLLIRGPQTSPAPSTYPLAQTEAFVPESVTATFVGTAALSAFLPTLSIYAQSGELLARSPASEVAAGDSAEVTFAPLLRAAQGAAAGGGGYPFAASGQNGFYLVPSGVATFFGLDAGAIQTSDPSIFTVEASAVAGVDGLGVHATGFYVAFWTVNYKDRFGFRVVNPETFVCEAADGSGSIVVVFPALLSYYGRGYTDLSGNGSWDCGFVSPFVVHGSTNPNDAIILLGRQTTGQTIRAYTELLVFQLSTDTFGF